MAVGLQYAQMDVAEILQAGSVVSIALHQDQLQN